MPPVRTLVVLNQKGGVGKTTTVVNLGAAVAAEGHRICLVDLDPQAHLTLHLGIEPGSPDISIYEVLGRRARIEAAAVEITHNLHLVPSVIDLAAAEIELVSAVGRERILRDSLAECSARFDYVLIDCPPSLGLLTLNALAAAEEVFIPLQPHFLALQGLGKLLETISLVRQRINPSLRIAGIILCLHEKHTRLASEVVADLEEFLAAARNTDKPWADTRIFSSTIRRNIKLAECPSYGKTIFEYDPRCIGADDYRALASEFLAYLTSTPTPPPGDEAPVGEPPAAPAHTESDAPDSPLGGATANDGRGPAVNAVFEDGTHDSAGAGSGTGIDAQQADETVPQS